MARDAAPPRERKLLRVLFILITIGRLLGRPAQGRLLNAWHTGISLMPDTHDGLAFYRKAKHGWIFAGASTERGVASGAKTYLGFARHVCAHLVAQVRRNSCTLFSPRGRAQNHGALECTLANVLESARLFSTFRFLFFQIRAKIVMPFSRIPYIYKATGRGGGVRPSGAALACAGSCSHAGVAILGQRRGGVLAVRFERVARAKLGEAC